MPTNINSLNVAGIPVYNAQVPPEGPMALDVNVDFSQSASYAIDLRQLVEKGGNMSMVQTIFIDTTGLTGNTSVVVGGGVQTIIVKQNTQGYYPVVCPNPPRFEFDNAGGAGTCKMILHNVPISPAQWPTA